MTVFVGLLPALVMFGGALISLFPLPVPSRVRNWIPLFTCAGAGIALLIAAQTTEPLALLAPNEALPALSLTVQWSGVALTFGLFLLVILSGRFLFGMENDSRDFVFGALVTAGAALVFFAADNFTTVAAAWVFVELGLLVVPARDGESRDAAARALGWNLAAIVAWLTAGMILSNQGSSLRLIEVALEGAASFLILVAIWFRSGLYPFHAAAPTSANAIGMRVGLPMLLGGYLMTRLLMQTQGEMAFNAELQILALLAVGVSALVVVGQFHGGDALTWTLRAVGATLLLLPFFVNARVAPALSVWFALGMFAVCTFVEIAMQWRAEAPRVRLTLIVWIVALVMIGALPLAPTFWSRVGLLASAYARIGIALWLLLVATMSLTLVPVWREIFASSQVAPKAPSPSEYGALVLVVLSSFALSVAPFIFVAPFGTQTEAGGALAYNALFQSANFASLLFLLAGLLVPLLASFELARRWAPRANLLPTPIANILDLTIVVSALDRVYRLVRALVQQSLSLLEQPPIAWLIFLVIWVAVWVIGLGS